jgi:alpha-2-macroglobulin
MRKSIRLVLGMALFFWAVPAHAQKSFVTDELTSDATRLEQNVGKDLGTLATQPLAKLRKDADQVLARKDFKTAAKYLAAIVAATPKDAGAWLNYSRAAIAAGDDDHDLQQTGTAAAYIAYQHASDKPQRALALAWLGEIYAKRSMWRPSLDAYRASLDLADIPLVRNIYEDSREKHGFRIVDYKIDNESASPRVCFQLSLLDSARSISHPS